MSAQNTTKKWSANQLKFIHWLAIPKKERKPRTQQELAREMGLDPATLSDWKNIPGFTDEVTTLARQALRDALTDVYAALIKRAIDGDVPAIKLAMEMTREYVPRQELTGKDGDAIRIDVSQMTDDELRAIAES